jgi:hypothetical protein
MKPIFAFAIAVTWKQHFLAEIPVWARPLSMDFPGERADGRASTGPEELYDSKVSNTKAPFGRPNSWHNQRIRGDTSGCARTVPAVSDPTLFTRTTTTRCLDVACLPPGCLDLNVSS